MSEIFKLSGYREFSNKEIDWLPMDTEELFKKNLKVNFQLLKEQGWVDNKFTYRFNRDGFRCNDFPQDDSIAFLGCSFTIGIGLPESVIFPTLVSQSLKLKCVNLGVGGSSADTAFRLAFYWLPKIKPKLVVLLSPHMHRLEIYDNKEFHHHRPTHAKGSTDCILSEEYCYLNQQKNILGIEKICNSLGTKFLGLKLEKDFIQVPNDFARDLSHSGIQSHLETSKKILSLI